MPVTTNVVETLFAECESPWPSSRLIKDTHTHGIMGLGQVFDRDTTAYRSEHTVGT